MTQTVEKTLERPNGPSIFYRSWIPDAKPRGVVVIVPGFNSHSGYYDWTAKELNSSELAVFAVDLRGRGQSQGERFYVENFDDYVADVKAVVEVARTAQPGQPMFLLGHSAGGVVACLYALDHATELSGLICESFAHELPAPDFALAVIKGLSHLLPRAHVLRLKNEDFSRDQSVLAAMDADPLIASEAQPAETLAALVRADERLRTAFPSMTLPVLILHGTADKAAKPSGSQHLYDRVGSRDKTLKLYQGSFHDPLNDLDRTSVIEDIRHWIGLHATGNRIASSPVTFTTSAA